MANKHLWIRQLSSLLLVTGVVIAGCGTTVDDQGAGPQCAAGEFLDYDDGLCGNGSPAARCESVNTPCSPSSPACGCDGTAYPSECDSYKAGVDVHLDAKQCTAPPDMFPCGRTYCTRNTMFCDEIVTDSGESPSFFCEGMVAQCASAPSCECIAEWWSDDCESDGMGAFYTTSHVSTGP